MKLCDFAGCVIEKDVQLIHKENNQDNIKLAYN